MPGHGRGRRIALGGEVNHCPHELVCIGRIGLHGFGLRLWASAAALLGCTRMNGQRRRRRCAGRQAQALDG